jgi:hypothetical protein
MLIRELINLGAVFVTGSGNRQGYPNGYPALFAEPGNRNEIKELIVVGSVLGSGIRGAHSDAPWVTCYAPGYSLEMADSVTMDYRTAQGTSYSSATVAGLAAYFRGLDPTLTTAARVKQRIVDLAYRRPAQPNYPNDDYPDKVVWNGQMGGRSVAGDCSGGSMTKRQSSNSGGSCPVAFPPETLPLTFRTGASQPTCAGAGCGSSCGGGFFCAGSPLKQNPDFLDPRNPDSVQNPDSPYYGDWDGTITRTTTTTTTSTSTSTTMAPTSTRTPDGSIGDTCYANEKCDDDCPTGQILACRNGVCSCAADQNIPPYGTMCQSLEACLSVYWCASGDTMVCEPRDYSHGEGLCLCVAGSND